MGPSDGDVGPSGLEVTEAVCPALVPTPSSRLEVAEIGGEPGLGDRLTVEAEG
jgi:hypothetical protein